MPSYKTIETASVVIECHRDGFVRVTTKPIHQTVKEAREALDVYSKTAEELGQKVRLLVDMRQVLSLSREARLLYQSEEAAAVSRAAALLVDSGISKVIGNFAIGLNKGLVSARLFTSEDEAIAWLDSLKAE